MSNPIRLLAFTAAVGAASLLGMSFLTAETPPPKSAEPMAPIQFTKDAVPTKTAVTPKEFTESVKKGIAYLIKNQQADGGWNQGGGWRTGGNGQARVEGKEVEDPSDMGNTCYALLALVRAGNTATEGEHKEAVKKGLKYVLAMVEKSKGDDLYVTDVRNTQLQSKVGPYIDTFLANLVMAELKGKAGDSEKQLVACLEKTMTKIVKAQTKDGQFAGNGGWAPVLSLAVANKGIARAKQNGAVVDDKYFARVAEQAKAASTVVAAATPGDPKVATTGKLELTGSGTYTGATTVTGGSLAGDAGVPLYNIAQKAGNNQDVVNAMRFDAEKWRKVAADPKAKPEEKAAAEKNLDGLKNAERENGKIQEGLATSVKSEKFVAGFGSNGGEEFLSFLNISETLVLKGGKDWTDWDDKMRGAAEKAQDKDGSWSGQHCITGKTFCTSGALLVMLADRTPFPLDVLNKAKEEVKTVPQTPEKK